jgi:cyclophilin family peptidyl-prolyl cis-trans isomerase
MPTSVLQQGQQLCYCARSASNSGFELTMKKVLFGLLLSLSCAFAVAADEVPAHPYIEVVTTEGTFKLELDGRRAPLTVGNFLQLVDSGYFDGTVFHRVIPGFMAQGGGYTPSLKLKEGDNSVPNESGNGMSNVRGTIAMARTSDPHSANSQFFINVGDNSRLDPADNNWGYTVFGYVIEGMDVVDKIANTRTGPGGEFRSDVPVVPIVIKKMSRITFE